MTDGWAASAAVAAAAAVTGHDCAVREPEHSAATCGAAVAVRAAAPAVARAPLGRRRERRARVAADGLQRARLEIDSLMVRHQLKLPDRQISMAALSQKIQDQVVMLVSALWADGHGDPLVREAAVVLGNDFHARLTGRPPTGRDIRTATRLGEAITKDGFVLLDGIVPDDILMRYDDTPTDSQTVS